MWHLLGYGFLALGQAPQADPSVQRNPTGDIVRMLTLMVFFFVVMYVLMIRPQQKKAKQHTNMLKTLKAGDRVLTSGGVLGVVVSVKDKTVSLRSADTKMEVVKSAVSEILERASGDVKTS